jgi:guanosine-3',5'-bis(diphosphate) 3'-pyrophosphohydrolase
MGSSSQVGNTPDVVILAPLDQRHPAAVQDLAQGQTILRAGLQAKQIKMVDKICNLADITPTQPVDWPLQRKRDYLEWAEMVVAGCRGCSPQIEQYFDAILKEKRQTLETQA